MSGEKGNTMSTEDEAIENTDASDLTQQEQAEPLSSREEKMEALVDKYNTNDTGEAQSHTIIDDQLADEPSTESEPEPEDGEPEMVDEQPESPVYLKDGKWLTKVKVNGVEFEREFDNVKATAQKHESADERLAQAARQEQQIQQAVADFEATKAQDDQPSNDAESNRAELLKHLGQYREQVYDGDETADDTLADAIMGVVGRNDTPILDTNQIAQAAASEAVRIAKQETYNASLGDGVKWLKDNHPNLMSDKVLYSALDAQSLIVEQAEPSLTPEQVLKKSAELVVKRFGGEKSKEAETTTPDRQQNKNKITRMPESQVNSRHQSKAEEEQDLSPASVIESMRQERRAVANRK